MKHLIKLSLITFLNLNFILTSKPAVSLDSNSSTKIPALNPQIPPLAEGNRSLLFKRVVATFDHSYEIHHLKSSNKSLADSFAIYYLRQELQALIDMWRATGDPAYLEQAKTRVFKAINDAKLNCRTLLWHNQPRGRWPCFISESQVKTSGGHGQLWDFQGSAGFMMVANALNQANKPGWKEIANFVEREIVEKWLFYIPSRKPEHFHSRKSNMYLLTVLNTSRDKREHFATICMDLHKLGYDKYPYEPWAKFLTEVYIGIRKSLDETAPNADELGKLSPKDWGVIPKRETGGLIWYWPLKKFPTVVQDTSHANRTVWLAAKSFHEGLIDKNRLDSFVNTLKHQVWAVDKGPFYFNNYIDGQDGAVQRLGPGLKGNVWFGWHRLAAYDDILKDLFISLAYDLTNGGPNVIGQNKDMENAPLCFLAWAARLLAPDGEPQKFP